MELVCLSILQPESVASLFEIDLEVVSPEQLPADGGVIALSLLPEQQLAVRAIELKVIVADQAQDDLSPLFVRNLVPLHLASV